MGILKGQFLTLGEMRTILSSTSLSFQLKRLLFLPCTVCRCPLFFPLLVCMQSKFKFLRTVHITIHPSPRNELIELD
ncbi:MAG: hypothetical protein B6D68_01675 [spirochete symbiont of Stewartia floridana]|nr:MAG: hypothetical protein B6D68_01675 [spirochete symbiont of Stewartia floridana]